MKTSNPWIKMKFSFTIVEWFLVLSLLISVKYDSITITASVLPIIRSVVEEEAGNENSYERRQWENEVKLGIEDDIKTNSTMKRMSMSFPTTLDDFDYTPDEEINRDFHIPDFVRNLIPSLDNTNDNLNQSRGVTQNEKDNMPSFLTKLLQNVIIDRNSVFRVQFFNSDFESQNYSSRDDGNGNENETSIVPQAIFGGPLCFGLCFTGQVYSDNSSVRILSDKRISLFPGTALTSTTEAPDINLIPNFQQMESNNTFNASLSSSSISNSHVGTLSWLSGWIYNSSFSQHVPRLPSISSIQLPQYSLIPQSIIEVPSFIG